MSTTRKRPILGGWNVWTQRIQDDGWPDAMVRVNTPDHGEGDRVRITVQFDVTLSKGSGNFVNRLMQETFDGYGAGALDAARDDALIVIDPVSGEPFDASTRVGTASGIGTEYKLGPTSLPPEGS